MTPPAGDDDRALQPESPMRNRTTSLPKTRVYERGDGALMRVASHVDVDALPETTGHLCERGHVQLNLANVLSSSAHSILLSRGYVTLLGPDRVSVVVDLKRQTRNAARIESRRALREQRTAA